MSLRILLLLSLVPVFASFGLANEIDELKTASDVNQFLKKVAPKDAELLSLDTKQPAGPEYGANTFHKVDLDGNGRTDLLVESKYLYTVTDQNKFAMIDRGGFTFYRYSVVSIEKKGADTVLRVRPRKLEDMPAPPSDKETMLVFKFGGFIEYNPKPDNLKVEDITFATTGCFGSCPIFILKIRGDHTASYEARKFNPADGQFSGAIDASDFNRLVEIINYMDLASLKNEYSVNWTDDQGSTLSITYNGGKTKTISDYGMIGSYGLQTLYDNLSDLRTTQKWTKAK